MLFGRNVLSDCMQIAYTLEIAARREPQGDKEEKAAAKQLRHSLGTATLTLE
jgi:hypothetical protein